MDQDIGRALVLSGSLQLAQRRIMKDPGYINPNLQQMGTKPQLRKRLKSAFAPSRTLPSHETVQVARPIKCPNSTSWFDLNKRPAHQQLQANLFKLPLEIRLLIYKHVIDAWTGGSVEGYHVVRASELSILKRSQKDSGLTFVPCDCPSSGTVKEDPAAGVLNRSFGDYNFPYSSSFHWWTRHKLDHAHADGVGDSCYCRASGRLGIFLSCRRIYSEAIDLLYSSHTFDLAGLEATHCFLSIVSPHSLNMIRFLTLNSIEVPTFYTAGQTPPHTSAKKIKELRKIHRLGEEQWLHSCQIIQSMRGLGNLRIKIDNDSFVLEPLFLKPLMGIRLKDGLFMVEVPDCFRVGRPNAKHISGNDGKIPFEIERAPPLLEKPPETIDHAFYNYGPPRGRKLGLLDALCCPVRVVVRVVPIVVSFLRSEGEKKLEYYKECYREGARSR